MQGTVEKIWQNETKEKKPYSVVEIGGEKYSVWDPKLMEGLAEGSRIDYEWKKSGDFRKITALSALGQAGELDPYHGDRKSREIVRMSCLKSAAEILYGVFIDPDVKTGKAIEIAREFERYVTGDGVAREAREGEPHEG
ncbi:MAG: hypothetical protein AB1512_02795 [Thermodesulfobacteriota bacterium]